MELFELKQQITNNRIEPLYVFIGPEQAIMDVYIKQIAKCLKSQIKRVDGVANIYSTMQNYGFLSSKNCYVIRNDNDYPRQEKAWEKLITGQAQAGDTVILIYDKIDKRGKFYNGHKKVLVEFEKLAPELLTKYIHKEIGLDPLWGLRLANMCDCDYSKILLECDKLKVLAEAEKVTIEKALEIAMREKLIYTPPKDTIFELVDLICKRRTMELMPVYNDFKQLNESPLGLLSLLYTNFKNMLLVQSTKGEPNVSNKTGLTGWQIKIATEKGSRYSIGELVYNLGVIRDIEKGIKTGGIDQLIATDYLISKIL